MARVFVYERAVNAVLTDLTFYDKLNHSVNGIKIKDEVRDQPDTYDHDASLAVNASSAATRSKSRVIGDRYLNSTNNKENERVLCKKYADSRHKESDVNKRKRKYSLASGNLGEQGLRTVNKRRKYSRRRGRGDQYHKRKKQSKYLTECDVCFVLFTNEREMKNHKLLNGSGYRRACDKCNAVFTSDGSLHRHRCSPQPFRKYFICNFCDRRFSYRKPLQSHLFHIHGNCIFPSVNDAIENVDNAAIENIDHLKFVTNDDADRVEKYVLKQNTYDGVANDCTREKLNSPNGSAKKKLRQTTLTEFLPFFTKKECVTPEKGGFAENTVVIPKENGKEGINALSHKGVINTSIGNENSGCLTRIETDSFTDIISIDKIKTEPEDHYDSTPSQNASQKLRQMVREDAMHSSVKLYNEMSLEPGDQRDSIIITRRRKRESAQILWERKVKVEYECKECVIPLERCDWILKGEHLFKESERSMLAKIGSIKTEENSDEDQSTSRNYVTLLKALDVPLVRVNKLVNVETNEEEEERRSARKRVTPDSIKVSNDVVIRCTICKASFSSKKNMRNHVKLDHTIYISSICNVRYTSKIKLWSHYLLRHTDFESKKCRVCHEKLKTRVLLKRHMILHCIKSIRSRNDRLPINREARCNAPRKFYRCEGCGKRYWWNSCLNQHRKLCSRVNTNKNTNEKEEASCRNSINSPLGNEETTASIAITSDSVADNSVMKYSGNVSLNTSPSTRFVSALSHSEPSQSQSPTVASRKRLINSIVCVRGYQIDVTGLDKTKFPCIVCNRQFQTFQNLCLHERTYCKPADSPCMVCGTAFTTKRLLQRHVIATHAPSSSQTYKYFCKFCNQGFIKKPNLQVHERHFHSNDEIVTTSKPCQNNKCDLNVNTVCSVCNLVFESYERFVEHNMYYYKGQVFTCMFCSRTFQGLYMLHHHSKLIHYAEATRSSYAYMCYVCNEGFSQESHFHAHKFHVHLRNVSADSSDQDTIQDHNYALKISNLDKPMKIPLMTYTCDICTLNFTNETDLRMHEMEYSLDGDFQCNKCERKCSTYAILSKHQSLNHNDCDTSNCYKCRFCGEVLTTSKSIVCHERHFHATNCASRSSHSKDESQTIVSKVLDNSHNARDYFTCVTCGMRFDEETELKDHLLEYSDIGAYSCNVCSRKFGDVNRLEKHRMKHVRVNAVLSEHHCPICHEEFPSATDVRVHVLHLHGYETFSGVPTKPSNDTRTNDNSLKNMLGNVETVPVISLNGSISSSTDQPQHLLRCSECYIVFDTQSNLQKHRLQFIDAGNYICEYCGRKFLRLKMLKAHVNKHTANIEDQERYLKHECLHCGEKFRHLTSQYSHIVHLHGKDKLKDQNKSAQFACSNVDLDASMKELLGDFEDGRLSEKDPLEVADGTIEQPVASNPVNESNGEQEVSSSTVVNTVDEESISREDAANSGDLLTCPICSLTFTASKRFKLHFKFTHCDSTFAEEREFMERARKVQASLSSTGHDMPKDFNVDVDDSDVVEVVWEKKPRNRKRHPKIQASDNDNSYVQVSRDCYLSSTINHIGSSTVANAATVAGNLSKLRVKSFAKCN